MVSQDPNQITRLMRNWVYLLSVFLVISSCSSAPDGFEPLFNGEDLEGWHVYGGHKNFNGWTVSDGVLLYDPQLRTESISASLTTDEQFTDFELSMDWMIDALGNSGVMWGVLDDGTHDHPYRTGPEIQILDDTWTDYIQQRGDINRAGALYNLMPPSKVVAKGPNEWNHFLLHVDQTNQVGFLDFNGERVLEFSPGSDEWLSMILSSNFRNWHSFAVYKTGHISLQEHGSKVAFKNIYIKRLNE